jgi:small subunit ribosomal protein S8
VANDTITSMITSIRNAIMRNTKIVRVPATHTTRSIAKILWQEGFILGLRERNEDNRNLLVLALRSQDNRPEASITTLRRISKPGLRVYSNRREIPRVLGGMGIVILSTSEGIMVDREARQKQIGGEVLCYIW